MMMTHMIKYGILLPRLCRYSRPCLELTKRRPSQLASAGNVHVTETSLQSEEKHRITRFVADL